MSGRPTIVDAILSRLSGDAAVTAIATGGVWKRRLQREGPGATPAAFYDQPPYQPRPAIVITDGGDATNLGGVRSAFLSFPTLLFYAPATDNGRAAVADLWDAARSALVGGRLAVPNGLSATVERVAGRAGVRDAPDIEGAVIDTMRLQVAGVYATE